MVAKGLPIGVQSRFFVGDYTATTTPLTGINVLRTQGVELVDDTPGERVEGINSNEQLDLRSVTLTATFYSDTGIVYNLARKLSLTADKNSGSVPSNKYVVFIADDEISSYILHECSIVSAMNLKYNKGICTQARITFQGVHRNTDYELLSQGSLDDLLTDLGVRAPLNNG